MPDLHLDLHGYRRRLAGARGGGIRTLRRGGPRTGLHPSDVEKLTEQLHHLVDQGNTVITVEHDMQVIANSDWVIDLGPGAGDEGGKIVESGAPTAIASNADSRTAPFLAKYLGTKQRF